MSIPDDIGQPGYGCYMNVNLSPELEELVRRKVETGLYNNSDVVREALRLLDEQDRLRKAHLGGLQAALAEGLTQADRGELRDGAAREPRSERI